MACYNQTIDEEYCNNVIDLAQCFVAKGLSYTMIVCRCI